jgi:hypothetical protein
VVDDRIIVNPRRAPELARRVTFDQIDDRRVSRPEQFRQGRASGRRSVRLLASILAIFSQID